MAAEFIVDGDKITIRFDYTALTGNIQALAGDAAHGLYDKGFGNHGDEKELIVWEDLNNTDKLAILDAYVKNGLRAEAASYASNAAQKVARDDAEVEAETKYGI